MSAKSRTKPKEHKRLVLIDSHAILHRAYHAIPGFSTSKGEPTGALYGLITMLLKVVDELSPDYVIAARDLPGGTFRDGLFADYKGHRAEADDELVEQIKRAPDVFEAFGIPVYSAPGFEADDCIGTIVEQLKDSDIDVVIATGDLDTLQLIRGDAVQVYTLRQGIQDTILYDEDRVRERYGFGPEHIVDYKALRGDPSDNIKGVKGIGEKTAEQLITNFGSIEDIYKTLKKSPAAFEKVGIKKRIVGLLEAGESDARLSKQLATISREAPIDFKIPQEEWKVSNHMGSIDVLCDRYEFRSIKERLHSRLKNLVAADVARESETQPEELDPESVRETALMLWLLHSDITEPSLEQILDYAEARTFSEAREIIAKKLRETGRLQDVFERIEKPLIPVVQAMNARGVCIDKAALEKLAKEYRSELGAIAGRIFQHAGHEFNINSTRQLATVLYDELKITPERHRKTSTGLRTTREEELAKLSAEHPIIDDVLQYRELQKLLSTYVEKMAELVTDDGRLHAEFLQAGTVTGRMGCQNPNLQNIPIRTEYGRRIRSAFNAPRGFRIVSLDYSQIELRVAAGLSGDEKLIDVFKRGNDIHTAVAANVFNVPAEHVDKEMRRRAKVINFGILYGMGVNALRTNLGATVSRDEAARYLDEYFASYPQLARWVEKIKRDGERQGFVETVFGRRRYLPGFKSALPQLRSQAERFAVNAPIQGSQADIIKLAMVRADEMIKEKGWEEKVKLVLQVHDELVYEIHENIAEDAAREIRSVMEHVAPTDALSEVPIVAEAKIGENWDDMRKIS
ncbi:MAG TPA: DNA polymerase [Candidatus Paceibacterota bacterium]|nr:DNA polymerase [Candidatus Paceibacterota bacterium]